jgi:amidohydrolase
MSQALSERAASALVGLEAVYPEIEALYIDLHQHPELSLQEEQTAAKVAARLKPMGYEVATGVGGTGVVGLLRNGSGQTVMLRADMDALPLEEKTGLPYASKVTAKDPNGAIVPVMHACGHDVHTACLVGVARLLADARESWRGTLMLVFQPAEEVAKGAEAMVKDGLFTRFPKPDYALGQHTSPNAVGLLEYCPGYAASSCDNVTIRLFGKGGHGSMPQTTVDPVLMAAALTLRLQTIVSREVAPQEVAVVTVGAIKAGLKHNIIPDEAVLELTVRTYKAEVREQVLAAITRMAKAEAVASNAPREPELTIVDATPSLYNDPELTERMVQALRSYFGAEQVVQVPPMTPSEDFPHFTLAGIPSFFYDFGVSNAEQFKASNGQVPYNHSPLFAPDREPSLKMGMKAFTVSALELLQ